MHLVACKCIWACVTVVFYNEATTGKLVFLFEGVYIGGMLSQLRCIVSLRLASAPLPNARPLDTCDRFAIRYRITLPHSEGSHVHKDTHVLTHRHKTCYTHISPYCTVGPVGLKLIQCTMQSIGHGSATGGPRANSGLAAIIF